MTNPHRHIHHSVLLLLLLSAALSAQETSGVPLQTDSLLLTNGEKFIGHLQNSRKGELIFKSETAGAITVKWDKVKQLQTAGKFAVIPPSADAKRSLAPSDVREGPVEMADGKLAVTPSKGDTPEPVAPTETVVTEPDFEKVMDGSGGILKGWKGAATGGASLVAATQTSQSYTGSLTLLRVEPAVDWLALSNRTSVNVTASYGEFKARQRAVVTAGGKRTATPVVKTEIFHGNAERDEYFTNRVYGFGQLAFDHNYSQGLDLAQLYGGGLGVTIFKSERQQLDAKASIDYIRQSFLVSFSDRNLLGSQFGDTYVYKLPLGIIFSQAFTITPTWSDSKAWSALGTMAFVLPVSKKLGFNLTAQDGFFNDPPPPLKRNSLQSSLGLTLAIP